VTEQGFNATVADVRAFWNKRPCNLRHSQAPIGSKQYFDEVEARKFFVEPHIPAFADYGRWKGKKVLEIGCGLGTDTINFARAGALVTAVDLSDASLELCKRRFELYGLEATFYSGNAEALSSFVPVEAYDLIYSFGVIHHTPHPERVVRELAKYCGPQTEIRIMVYSKWSWKALWIIFTKGRGAFWRADELTRANSEAEFGSPVTYTYTSRSVRKLLSGFNVRRVWKDHIFPYRIDKYVKYQFEVVWYFRFLPRPLFDWLERRLGWHLLVEARAANSG
jgi:SAM-dependent methyltransferase